MKKIIDYIKNQNMAVISALIFFILGLLLVIFGFWKTLFLIFMTTIGYFIGKKFLSNKENFKELLDKIIPPGRFR